VKLPFSTACFAWSSDYAADDSETREWIGTDRPTIERRKTTQISNTGMKDNSSSPPLQTTLRLSTEADLSATTSMAPPHPTSSSSSLTAHTQKRTRPFPMYHQERPVIGYTTRAQRPGPRLQSVQVERKYRFRTAATMRVMEREIASGKLPSLLIPRRRRDEN
jgi:hypothetical protein